MFFSKSVLLDLNGHKSSNLSNLVLRNTTLSHNKTSELRNTLPYNKTSELRNTLPYNKTNELRNKRIVQQNLLFVLGLPNNFTEEDTRELGSSFGNISKVILNTSKSYMGAQKTCATAYITYETKADAARALYYLGGYSERGPFRLNDIYLKCNIGTTKYCDHFLRKRECLKGDECLFFHKYVDDCLLLGRNEVHTAHLRKLEIKLLNSYGYLVQQPRTVENESSDSVSMNSSEAPTQKPHNDVFSHLSYYDKSKKNVYDLFKSMTIEIDIPSILH